MEACGWCFISSPNVKIGTRGNYAPAHVKLVVSADALSSLRASTIHAVTDAGRVGNKRVKAVPANFVL